MAITEETFNRIIYEEAKERLFYDREEDDLFGEDIKTPTQEEFIKQIKEMEWVDGCPKLSKEDKLRIGTSNLRLNELYKAFSCDCYDNVRQEDILFIEEHTQRVIPEDKSETSSTCGYCWMLNYYTVLANLNSKRDFWRKDI